MTNALGSKAFADDATDIQARVTLNLRDDRVRNPGLFAQYTVVRDGPYARVSASLGALGYGSETFVLSKKSGHWIVLLHGGGLAGTSELVAARVPYDVARALERTACTNPDYRSDTVTVTHARLDDALVHAARISGTSALPSRTIEIVDGPKTKSVRIYPPLDFTSCTFDSRAHTGAQRRRYSG